MTLLITKTSNSLSQITLNQRRILSNSNSQTLKTRKISSMIILIWNTSLVRTMSNLLMFKLLTKMTLQQYKTYLRRRKKLKKKNQKLKFQIHLKINKSKRKLQKNPSLLLSLLAKRTTMKLISRQRRSKKTQQQKKKTLKMLLLRKSLKRRKKSYLKRKLKLRKKLRKIFMKRLLRNAMIMSVRLFLKLLKFQLFLKFMKLKKTKPLHWKHNLKRQVYCLQII